MRSSNEAWDHLGELSEDDAIHVLTRLFALYEEQEQRNPDDPAAPLFFRNLITALEQTSSCNLNRR
ncbi:MAG: hypothetical protein SD837_00655 [Candidatus Electrothrix scaldis]|nr:MAG: hypothetical protein SD837_00655 [Candidatus Electrothrix sp. GW3-3]